MAATSPVRYLGACEGAMVCVSISNLERTRLYGLSYL